MPRSGHALHALFLKWCSTCNKTVGALLVLGTAFGIIARNVKVRV